MARGPWDWAETQPLTPEEEEQLRKHGLVEERKPSNRIMALLADIGAGTQAFIDKPFLPTAMGKNALAKPPLAPISALVGNVGRPVEKLAYEGERTPMLPTMTKPIDPDLGALGLAVGFPVAKAGVRTGKALAKGVEREFFSPTVNNIRNQYGSKRAARGSVGEGPPPEMPKPDEWPKMPEIAPLTPIPTRAARTREAPKDTGLKRTFQGGDKEGIIRGSEAFGGITEDEARVMQRNYADRAQRGATGKYWYDDTSKDIFRLSGEDVPRADKFTEVLATTSSRTPVGANLMYGNRGWNQWLVGDPVHTGGFPKRMSKDIVNIMENDVQATGFKRSPYAGGLQQHWRPDPSLRPVHDIHDVRAHGILDPKTGKLWSKGVGEAGHRVLDEQTAAAVSMLNARARNNIRAAKRSGASDAEIAKLIQEDWTNARAQAAAWTAQRAAKDKIPMEEAAKHYGDFINDYSAMITREWNPGKTTKHLPQIHNSPWQIQQDFNDAMEAVITGPGGIDKIAHGVGALADTTLPNLGNYKGTISPGFSTKLLVGKGKGTGDIDPASAKVADLVAASHGLFGLQDQAAWNYLGGKATGKAGGAIQFKRGSPFSPDELDQLGLMDIGADIPQVDPKGARMLVFEDPAATKKMLTSGTMTPEQLAKDSELVAARKKMMQNAKVVGEAFGAEPEWQARSSNIFPVDENFNAPANWSAKPYVEKIEAAGPRAVENWNQNVAPMAGDLLKVVEEQSALHGWTSEPFYKPMMEGIARGGLAELKRLIAAGIVPVAVLGLFGLGAMFDQQNEVQ